MKIKELEKVIATIEKKKAIIAKHRDDIRDLYDESGGLLESFDLGVDWIDQGIRAICDGIDSISEVV